MLTVSLTIGNLCLNNHFGTNHLNLNMQVGSYMSRFTQLSNEIHRLYDFPYVVEIPTAATSTMPTTPTTTP